MTENTVVNVITDEAQADARADCDDRPKVRKVAVICAAEMAAGEVSLTSSVPAGQRVDSDGRLDPSR
jgi:hypothetical protein